MIDVLLFDAGSNWRWHLVVIVVVASIGCAIILQTHRKRVDPLNHLPRYEVVPGSTQSNHFPTAEALMRHGYMKHREGPFVIGGSWRRWDTVIIPPKVFDNLKSLPENEMSFYDALDTRFLHHFTTIKVHEEGGDTPMLKALAIDLPRHLKDRLHDIAEETDYAFATLFPKCDNEWVEVYPATILPRILALVSGRILVGLPLSRDHDFVDLKLGFFKNSFIAMWVLGMVPEPLRSLAARLLPPISSLKKAHLKMQRIMEPIIKQREMEFSQSRESQSDLLSWVIDNAPQHLKYNVRYQAHAQLITNVASIQSLYVASSHLYADLAAHPEYITPLREEWASLLKESPDGKISFEAMQKGWKFDSFVKESARCNPSQLTTLEYMARRELVLKDGTVLPKGTYLGVAASQLGSDHTIYSDPATFDGFRYEKLRREPGNEGKYLFTSTGLDQLSFGYGRHPCPGRFYAAHVIKIMMAKLIDAYDIKLPDGQGRPRNFENWIALKPDDKVPILIRKRR